MVELTDMEKIVVARWHVGKMSLKRKISGPCFQANVLLLPKSIMY